MNSYLLPIIIFISGVVSLVSIIFLYKNPELLRSYLQSSWWAFWYKLIGFKDVVALGKKVLLPISGIISLALIVWSIVLAINIQ